MGTRALQRESVPAPAVSSRESPSATFAHPSAPEVAPEPGVSWQAAERFGHRFEHIPVSAGHLRPTEAGRSLPEPTKVRMERAFGQDFSNVRIHENAKAEALDANAYTQGNHIHFAPGMYRSGTSAGEQLLGHELTHIVQQRAGRAAVPSGGGVPLNTHPALEAEADQQGARAARQQPVSVRGASQGLQAQSTAASPPIQAQLRRRRPAPPEEREQAAPPVRGLGSFIGDRVQSQLQDARSNPTPHILAAASAGGSQLVSTLTHDNPLAAAVSAPTTLQTVGSEVRRMGAEIGNAEYGNAALTGVSAASRVGGLMASALGLPGSGAVGMGVRALASSQRTHAHSEPDEAPVSMGTRLSAAAAPVVARGRQALSSAQLFRRRLEKRRQGKQD